MNGFISGAVGYASDDNELNSLLANAEAARESELGQQAIQRQLVAEQAALVNSSKLSPSIRAVTASGSDLLLANGSQLLLALGILSTPQNSVIRHHVRHVIRWQMQERGGLTYRFLLGGLRASQFRLEEARPSPGPPSQAQTFDP